MSTHPEAIAADGNILDPIMDPGTGIALSSRQATFLRYFTAILTDMVVLGLFAEYWDRVEIPSFTVILAAAFLLQLLLKLTLAFEHRVAEFWNAREGGVARFMRFFTAWLILFLSKFAMLEVLDVAFGDAVHFHGALHGAVAFITVVVVMVVTENLLVKFYRTLA